jgi:hypothetical protein
VIRVSVEVHSERARFRIAVWAESIERAMSLVRAHYPSCKASIVFPIEPEGFFANGSVPLSEAVYPEVPGQAVESAIVD